MKLELIASSPDGWALARDASSAWLLTPPYRQEDRHTLPPSGVRRCLQDEDFVPTNLEFGDWGSLCRHLEEMRVAHASPEQRDAAAQAADRLLARASTSQARAHLDRIEAALKAGARAGVSRALVALLESDAVVADPQLVRRVADLMRLAQRAAPSTSTRRKAQSAWTVSNSDAALAEFAAKVRRNHSLLPPAA